MSDIFERVMGRGLGGSPPAGASHEVSIPAEGVVTPKAPPFDHSNFLQQLQESLNQGAPKVQRRK